LFLASYKKLLILNKKPKDTIARKETPKLKTFLLQQKKVADKIPKEGFCDVDADLLAI